MLRVGKSTIEIKCKGSETVSLAELVKIQGKLKELTPERYQALRKSIIKNGFCEPVAFWRNPKNKEKQLISGNQRVYVLKTLEEEGFQIPKIPASEVLAKNANEAKKKLLALASSFGKVTAKGLESFFEDCNFDLEEVKDSMAFEGLDFDTSIKEDLVEKKESTTTFLKLCFENKDYEQAENLLAEVFSLERCSDHGKLFLKVFKHYKDFLVNGKKK